MSASIFIRRQSPIAFEWLTRATPSSAAAVACGDLEQLQLTGVQGAPLVFLAPAENVLLRQVAFEPAERKLLRQTIPYELEDQLAGDVDDTHFAFGAAGEAAVPVAAVAHQQMEHWLAAFAASRLDVQKIVPEQLLLPWTPGSWTLLIEDDRWLLRCGEVQGFAIDAELAPVALQLLLDESAELPQRLLVCCESQDHVPSDQEQLRARLPEMLRDIIEWRTGDYWQLLDLPAADNAALDLLQDRYTRGLPWKKWLQAWRVPALLLLVAVVTQLGVAVLEWRQLKNENLAVRTQIEQIYREVVPAGAVVDAEKQLQRKVSALQGGASGGVVTLLDKTARIVVASGASIGSINYDDKQDELRLSLLAPAFRDVETIRSQLQQAGFTATLTGSSEENGKVRAGLRVQR